MDIGQSACRYRLLNYQRFGSFSKEYEGDVGSIAKALSRVHHVNGLLLQRHSPEVEDDGDICADAQFSPEGTPGAGARIEGLRRVDPVRDHNHPIGSLAVLGDLRGADGFRSDDASI